MLVWNEQYETGHSLMDAQHRMLIGYFNRLEELSQIKHPTPEDVEQFNRFLDFLEDYIVMHFRDEEQCMHRHLCPAHVENRLAHQAFWELFMRMKKKLDAEGFKEEVVQELHRFCKNWIQQHILHIDVQIKPCLEPKPATDEED